MSFANRVIRIIPQSKNDYETIFNILKSRIFYPNNIPQLHIPDRNQRTPFNIQNDIDDLIGDLNILINDLDDLDDDLNNLQLVIGALQTAINEYGDNGGSKQIQIDALQQDVKDGNDADGYKQSVIDFLNNGLVEYSDVNGSKQNEIDAKLLKIDEKENDILSKQEELNILQNNINDLQEEIDNFEIKYIINPEVETFDYRQLFIIIGKLGNGFLIYTRSATTVEDFSSQISRNTFNGLETSPIFEMYDYSKVYDGRSLPSNYYTFMVYDYQYINDTKGKGGSKQNAGDGDGPIGGGGDGDGSKGGGGYGDPKGGGGDFGGGGGL